MAKGNSSFNSNSRRVEDAAQRNDAKFEGWRRGAKYYEYTDSNGKITTGETGRNTGGTYKVKFNEDIEKYAKMPTHELEKQRDAFKANSNNQYQMFARSAASRSASQVASFVRSDRQIAMINQVLRRREKK